MATQKKKHNTADTSILSWKECLQKGLPIKEKVLILKYLKDQTNPKSSRQIACELNIERTNITRTLFNLIREEKIKASKTDRCQITSRLVNHYSII